MTLVEVGAHDEQGLLSFMDLGRAYFAELDDTPAETNARFMASIVR